ncbi:hypothetical protein JI664_16065 [Rhodobacter sp. NTK016B]|uniref:hypothetical protein n=1 Tax=Rhodobacter sp. NTK016B TaxID=2759676 RepID=UPI001A8F530F|nr:hypothetical protein [Rhodobacter sp. NTK016B]MBN8293488.1 hypothetical protein [Rhodobacter sp. NTK016B]
MSRCQFRVFCVAFLLLLVPTGALQAGPWPQPRGGLFLSTTSTLVPDFGLRPVRTEQYVEYGFRPRLTLGGGFELSSRLERLDLFARWHPPDLPWGVAWGLTGGLRYTPEYYITTRAVIGIDLGRGWDVGGGNVWVRGGVRLLAGEGFLGPERDADLTLQTGWRTGRFMGIAAITHYENRWGGFTRLRPALGVTFGSLTVVAEAVIPPGGDVEALRVGIWSDF